MAHVVTKDPSGFVGAHIVQHAHARRGRRRQRTGSAMKPDPGDDSGDESSTSGSIMSSDGLFVLHGWITRYDVRLDAYTLFTPGAGTTQLPRGDVMGFISSPDFQMRRTSDDGILPPVEDTTSRLVDAPVRKQSVTVNGATPRRKRRAELAADAVDGRVACYLPFADRYRVVYEDGSTAEVSESEVVDGLLAYAAFARDALLSDASRKRRRAESAPPVSAPTPAAPLPAEDDGEETEDEAPMEGEEVIKTEVMDSAAVLLPIVKQEEERKKKDSDPPVEQDTVDVSVDDDEPMELLPLDDDDDDEETKQSDPPPVFSTPIWVPDIVALDDDEDDDMDITTSYSSISLTDQLASFYTVPPLTHAATAPFDKRTEAFDVLRRELVALIETDEAARLETALVADVLGNRDIKARDAVRRFVETGGLVVLNTVLNARAGDALVPLAARYDAVLRLLKVLAMLPTPSERQVMESSIGKTLGRLIKARFKEQADAADARMPKSIAHLARWVKHKWIANMHREPKPSTPAAASSSSSLSTTSTVAKKHLQRPVHGRPNGARRFDPEPIPRRAPTPFSPSNVPPPPPPPPPVVPFGAAREITSPRPVRSSLKPDWMRQKELLTRTRFTINADATAERQHYQQQHPVQRPATEEEDAGERGVFGRTQRLSFGQRWSVCEFFKDTPPSAVRKPATTTPSSRSSHHHHHRPRAILRKTSKYRESLGF